MKLCCNEILKETEDIFRYLRSYFFVIAKGACKAAQLTKFTALSFKSGY